jgi:hypothetical protein
MALMNGYRSSLLFCLLGILTLTTQAEEKKPAPHPLSEIGPKAKAVEPPAAGSIDKALQRGVAFLVADQNPNGSWGSAEQTKDLNIYAPVPGAHHAFRSAVTAMCVSALIEVGGSSPEVTSAIDRGEAWLLENLPKLRRATADALYNVWGHAYGIEALVRLHTRRASDAARQTELKRQIAIQVDLLDRYETVSGGWGYYDFGARTKKPAADPNSFTTATVLSALHGAKSLGVEVPQRLVDRGLAVIHRQQKPDLSYVYGEDHKYRTGYAINMPGGSVGRSQACNAVLRMYGDSSVSDAALEAWLERLFARNLWLDIGRKRPIPHESWYLVAGYFFYYGHYYSAFCIEQLPTDRRPPLKNQLAQILLPRQEKNGSWWDYPLYNYHEQYGTAFALMTLHRCR